MLYTTFKKRQSSRTNPKPPVLESPRAGALETISGKIQTTNTASSLPAVLRPHDLIIFMVLIVLFVNNNNGVQFGGPVAFLYWTLGLLTFMLPCAYVTQWLMKRYPGQGAPYLWAARILGPRWSFFSAFCAWLPGVLATVSVVEIALSFLQYFVPTWFTTPIEQCGAIIVALLIVTVITCIPLRWLKWLLLAMTICYLGVFALIGAAGASWLLSGHAAATALTTVGSWRPTGSNFALYGIAVLAFLGVDIPAFMGGEIRGGASGVKRASRFVWWGSAIAFLAYMAGTFGIMVVVPANQAGNMPANVQAIATVFGPLAGNVTAVVLICSQFALLSGYILMFSRLLVVVAQDRRLPIKLARTNRHGVPVLSIVVQSTITSIVTLLALIIVPALFGSLIHPDVLAFAIYNVIQAGTTVLWTCTIIQIFLLVLWLIYKREHRQGISRKQAIVMTIIALLGMSASGVGIWATISSSWLPSLITNNHWAILVLGVTIVSLVIGWLSGELPRVYALLGEQHRLTAREASLRAELQDAYNEQALLVEQQQQLVDELAKLYHEQARAAVTDAITGLPNHRAIMGRIDEELNATAQQRIQGESSCALLFVDLDHFKRINDTWGHLAGDAILREVGSRLRSVVREEDCVGRYGGEEFAILLVGADLVSAAQTAERLRATICALPCYWQADDRQANTAISVAASIGIAMYPLHATTRESLIKQADYAMYHAKNCGRNCVCVAESADTARTIVTLQGEQYPQQDYAMVQALAAMSFAHDQITGAHLDRVGSLAEATARMLQASPEEVYRVKLAALLHDIGKVGIPDAILYKPGPLTEDEWKIMRSHPLIGSHILEQAGGDFKVLAEVVNAHHERWDGKGYPRGLTGEAIPVGARLLAVVDAFDAMTSRRPYYEPVSVAEAKAELQRNSSSQFDPVIVDAFLRALDTVQDEESIIKPDQPSIFQEAFA